MAAILDLVIFHRFKELEQNAIPFFLITTMFQIGINKKITFNKHLARINIRAYTIDPVHTCPRIVATTWRSLEHRHQVMS